VHELLQSRLSILGVHAGSSDYLLHATHWPLILMACSAGEAVGPRALLLRSSRLKELLWGTLEAMARAVEKFRVEGLDKVRAQALTN
jgi:hypothetical protein